jgi:hypothetical protein
VATGICSWIRFKLNESNFSFEGNNTASSVTFEEYDKVRVIKKNFYYCTSRNEKKKNLKVFPFEFTSVTIMLLRMIQSDRFLGRVMHYSTPLYNIYQS